MIDILMFHRVLPKKEIDAENAYFIRGTLISTERFETVLKGYLDNNFIFKNITNLNLKSKINQVALTFDDGYKDNFLYALPILEKYNIKATFYPIVTYCEEQKIAPLDTYYQYINTYVPLSEKDNWITGSIKQKFLSLSVANQLNFVKNLPQKSVNNTSYMTMNQLRKLQEFGHEIGGHSLCHNIYTQMNKQEILEDVKKTKQRFLANGINITSYAFPDGKYNLESISVLKQQELKFACVIKSQHLTTDINYELERKFVKENEII